MAQIVRAGSDRQASLSPIPATTSEYITLMSHYHRAEIARMAGWRDRIDLTTNWAITVVGAMLSLSLSSPTAHHGIILLAMFLATLLLTIEARRYRFFDVFRGRVRRLERGWYAPIFMSEPPQDPLWLTELGKDLRHPKFLISQTEALSRRLRRTYVWMYLILLIAWLLKTTSMHPGSSGTSPTVGWQRWVENAAVGPVPGLLVIAGVTAFYGWLLYVGLRRQVAKSELLHGDVHV